MGYTVGDAGAAALLVRNTDDQGIGFSSFKTVSKYWQTVTVPGGGSMHPRDPDYSYMEGDGALMTKTFRRLGPEFLSSFLDATNTNLLDYDRVLLHQVSMPAVEEFLEITSLPREKLVITARSLGNMGAASLPVGFALAEEKGEIRRGDLVLWLGLAAGISLGALAMRY
jgi:3-oxoacyl-[acyl-carrier-protein] synthase-3